MNKLSAEFDGVVSEVAVGLDPSANSITGFKHDYFSACNKQILCSG